MCGVGCWLQYCNEGLAASQEPKSQNSSLDSCCAFEWRWPCTPCSQGILLGLAAVIAVGVRVVPRIFVCRFVVPIIAVLTIAHSCPLSASAAGRRIHGAPFLRVKQRPLAGAQGL